MLHVHPQRPHTIAATLAHLQVADAEAATARLVAQMTESSPNQDNAKSWPLQLLTGHNAGDVRSAHSDGVGQQQQQQEHSSGRENVPQLQQHTGKRSSTAQCEQALPAADLVARTKKQQAKRRKVSTATGEQCTAAEGVGGGNSAGLPPDAKEIVGRSVQQQFQEGVFKVGTPLLLDCDSYGPQNANIQALYKQLSCAGHANCLQF